MKDFLISLQHIYILHKNVNSVLRGKDIQGLAKHNLAQSLSEFGFLVEHLQPFGTHECEGKQLSCAAFWQSR